MGKRETCETVRRGSELLREAFDAMHSVIRSDYSVLSRDSSAWPSVLRDLADLAESDADEPRRRFSASQVKRAEQLCEIFTRMGSFTPKEKKATLVKARNPHMTWRKVARSVGGISWEQCRRTHDSCVSSFLAAASVLDG